MTKPDRHADTERMEDLAKIDAAVCLRALADEFEAGTLGGAHPEDIAARLREIAAHIDGTTDAG